MHRVGAHPADVPGLAQRIATTPTLHLGGTFTHLAVADEPERPETAAQLDRFTAVLDELARAGIDPGRRHAANSAGAPAHRRSHMDMVRVGIALYGIAPLPAELAGVVPLRPAMTLGADVTMLKRLSAGDGISYGLRHVVADDATVAIVPLGYADGVPRRLGLSGGEVLIGGVRRPIRGSVTMDQLMRGGHRRAAGVPGDPVVLLGSQGGECITAQEWADRLDLIAYEVVCGFSARLPRSTAGRAAVLHDRGWSLGRVSHAIAEPLHRGVGSLGSPDATRPGLQVMSHPLVTTTGSVSDTRRSPRPWPNWPGPATCWCWWGRWAWERPRSPRGTAWGSAWSTPSPAPRSRSRRDDGRLELNHLDVYRLEQLDELVEVGLYDLLDGERVVVIEWGDAIAPALPADYLRLVFVFGEGDDDRVVTLEPVGPRWGGPGAGAATRSSRGSGGPRADPRDKDRHPAGRLCHLRARGGTGVVARLGRSPRHPRSSRRRIDFVRRQAPRRVSTRSALVAVDVGPGLFTGLRVGISTAMAPPSALKVPMIGVSTLDLLAFPVRHSPRLIVAAIDARRGSSSTRSTVRCPAGCSGSPIHGRGRPRGPGLGAVRPGQGGVLVGRRLRSATPRSSAGLPGSRPSIRATSSPRPPRWCSWHTPGRCARTSCRSTRSRRCTSVGRTPRSTGPYGGIVVMAPGQSRGRHRRRRRHRRTGRISEAGSCRCVDVICGEWWHRGPDPPSTLVLGLFMSELRCASSRVYVVACRSDEVVGFSGSCSWPTTVT